MMTLAHTAAQNELKDLLESRSRPQTREWWQNYVKNAAPFMGVRMADIRSVVHEWYDRRVSESLSAEERVEVTLSLIGRRYSEEKLAGILLIQEILIPDGSIDCARHLERFEGLFGGGAIYDWNVCDWFCVKVLGPLIGMYGEGCARRIAGWHRAENLWQARASLVAFVGMAGSKEYHPLVSDGCRIVARREERFAKTAVGWILREISRHDAEFVREQVDVLLPHLTAESLRNATKYLDPSERKAIMMRFRNRR